MLHLTCLVWFVYYVDDVVSFYCLWFDYLFVGWYWFGVLTHCVFSLFPFVWILVLIVLLVVVLFGWVFTSWCCWCSRFAFLFVLC